MLHVTDLSFRHGERVLFDRAGAAISDGWKVGLVGRNGAGKSTLLKLIQGEYEADLPAVGEGRGRAVEQDALAVAKGQVVDVQHEAGACSTRNGRKPRRMAALPASYPASISPAHAALCTETEG